MVEGAGGVGGRLVRGGVLPSCPGWVQLPALACADRIHPRFFDEQLGSAVGAVDYMRGSGN